MEDPLSKLNCMRIAAVLVLIAACGVDQSGTSSGPPVVGGEEDSGLDVGFSVPTDVGTASDQADGVSD